MEFAHALVIGSLLFVLSLLLFISVVVLVNNFKTYAEHRDDLNKKRLDSLEALILNQFREILETLKK